MGTTIVLSLLFLAELLGSRYFFANGNHLGLGLLAIPELATAVLLLTSVFATDKSGRLRRGTLGHRLIAWLDPKVETTGQVRLCPIFWQLVSWITLAALVLFLGGLAIVFGLPMLAAGIGYLWRNFSIYSLGRYLCNTVGFLGVPATVILSLYAWWLFLEVNLKEARWVCNKHYQESCFSCASKDHRLCITSFDDPYCSVASILWHIFASVISFLAVLFAAIVYRQALDPHFANGLYIWCQFWIYTGLAIVAIWTTLGFLCGLPAFFLLAYDRSRDSFLGKMVSAGWGMVCPVIEVAPVEVEEENRDKK